MKVCYRTAAPSLSTLAQLGHYPAKVRRYKVVIHYEQQFSIASSPECLDQSALDDNERIHVQVAGMQLSLRLCFDLYLWDIKCRRVGVQGQGNE